MWTGRLFSGVQIQVSAPGVPRLRHARGDRVWQQPGLLLWSTGRAATQVRFHAGCRGKSRRPTSCPIGKFSS